jgi:hypothetical protein
VPFPRIEHCVICEDVRREVGRKFTILGFLGIAPNVAIRVQDFAAPVERLAFLLIGVIEGSGKFKVTLRISDAHGTPVAEIPQGEIALASEGRDRITIVASFPGIRLPGPGLYALTVASGQETAYTATFEAEQGAPMDLH